MKKLLLLLFLLLSTVSYSQSFLGLDGGFEGSATIDNTNVQTAPQTGSWTKANATQTITLETSTVRSGANSLKVNNSNTTGRRVWSPNFTFGSTTSSVTVQYWRRVTNLTNTQENQQGIINNTEGLSGTYNNPSAINTWEKVTYTKSSSTFTSIAGIVLHRQKGTGGDLYIDDMCVYTGSVDVTAPNSPGTVTVNNQTSSSLDVSWGAASGGVDNGGYIVVRYTVNPNANDDPNQNGIYAVGNTYTVTNLGTVRYVGTGTSFTDNSGLSASTTYYYKVYTWDKAYNYSGESSGNGTTTSGASPLVSVNLTGFVGTFGNIVNGSSSSSSSYTVSGSNLTNDIVIDPPAGFEIRTGANPFSTSNVTLTPSGGTVNSTTIDVRFTPTGTGTFSGNIVNSSTGATDQNVPVSGNGLSTEPTQASNITFSSVTTSGFTINFTAGNGTNRIVLVKEGSAVDSPPVDGTSYTANVAFGSGTEIGTGNFVVYNSTGTSVAVTGLSGATTYHVAVYEFNGSAGTENYNTTSAPTNSQLTLTPTTAVVINKYINSSPDAVELLVVEDNLDMRGMIIKDYSGSMASDGGGKFTFENVSLWSSVRSGTIIILRNDGTAADVTVGGTDYTIDVGLTNTTYFINNGGTFDIATTDMVQIKSSGSSTSGSTGAIHTLAGGTAGSQYTSAPTPKLIGSGTTGAGFGVFANNANSSIGDYNGTGATGNTAVGSLTFGAGNNSTNTTFINSLRNITVTSNTSLGAGTFHSLTISGASVTATLTGNMTVGDVSVGSGTTLSLGSNILTGTSSTLSGSGTISLTGNIATQITGFTTNTFGGAGGTGTYSFTGSSQQTLPTGNYNNLTVANASGLVLGGDVTIRGILYLNSGNGSLTVGAHTLTLKQPLSGNAWNTQLITDQTSTLVIDSTVSGIVIPGSVADLSTLTMNNNQVATGNGNIRLRDALNLNSGFIDMGTHTLEIGQSTAIRGAINRTSGGVRGTIKRWYNTSTISDGSGNIYPLIAGPSAAYVEAKLSFPNVGPTNGGSITVTYDTTTGAGSLPNQGDGNYIYIPEQNIRIINLAPHFWTISTDDGFAGGTYNLELRADEYADFVTDLRTIYILKRDHNTPPWTFTYGNHVQAGGTTSSPVLHFQGGTSFSDFGIGGNNDNPLPVELSSFTSTVTANKVKLDWATVSEENNSGFDIERKSETAGWTKIGNVSGHGTSNSAHNYSFTDISLNTGKYNYRLKQIDVNGNFKYHNLSNEVIIGTPVKFNLVQNYPNPFNPATTISYELPESKFVTLKIYDMMGREVVNLVNQNQDAGFYSVKFDASALSSGIYFYKMIAGNFVSTKKMMLMK